MPTITYLGNATGVSTATVDRALNGRSSARQETVRHVPDTAEEIGYHGANAICRGFWVCLTCLAPFFHDGERYNAGGSMTEIDDLRVKLILSTYHKTGTVWMTTLARRIAAKTGMAYSRYAKLVKNRPRHIDMAVRSQGGLVLVEEKSRLAPEDIASFHVAHLVRDPRDVLVSATHYHQKSGENFLKRPWKDKTPGRSYQEHISSLPDFESKAMFEMGAYSGRVFYEMMQWPMGGEKTTEWKYEDIIADEEMRFFREFFQRTGMTEDEVAKSLEATWSCSLFGALSDEKSRQKINHIRSGATRQWRKQFTPRMAREFSERHQPLLEKYGYEADDAWVEEVAAHAA